MGTGLFDFLVRHRRVYLIQTTAAGLIVMSFFALQVVFVIKSFHPNFIIAPIAVHNHALRLSLHVIDRFHYPSHNLDTFSHILVVLRIG